MKYKIAVFDIDGTLTNSRKELTKRTKRAIHKFQQAGGIVILASGRPSYGILPIAEELELKKYGGYVLAFNGGEVVECETGRTLYKEVFPEGSAEELEQAAKEHGVAILTYQGEKILTTDVNDCYIKKEAAITGMEIVPAECLEMAIRSSVTKFLMVDHEDHLADVERRMLMQFGNQYTICRSEPFFLEITPQGIDKAKALAWLLEYLLVGQKETIVFGDGFNDKTMIEYGGLGVVMENGTMVVKEVADYIAPSNDDDGVAWVIETLVLDKGEGWPVNQVKRLAVFDLDGTLNQIQTFALPAIRDALDHFGRSHITDQQILDSFGARDEDTDAVFFAGVEDAPITAFWQMVERFSEERYGDRYSAYEGTKEMLDQLRQQGYHTAVCSNAKLPYIMNVLVKIGILEQVDFIQPLLDGMNKSDTLCLLLKRCRPHESFMAGDRYFDLEAAKDNHIPFIACQYGFGTAKELAEADYKVTSTSEILDISVRFRGAEFDSACWQDLDG